LSRARFKSEIANVSASFECTCSRREGWELDGSCGLPISLHTNFGCGLELEEKTYELKGKI